MAERFERHRQPWTSEELQKLHTLAKKGMPLKSIAKALTRSEESVKDRAKLDKLSIAKLRGHMLNTEYDVIVLGAGAAGLMFAAVAGQRGRKEIGRAHV